MDLDYIDDWPVNSPDLNPIENVWRILKSRVKKHHPTTDKALRKAIEKEWTLLSFKEINECILGSRRGPDRGKGGAYQPMHRAEWAFDGVLSNYTM